MPEKMKAAKPRKMFLMVAVPVFLVVFGLAGIVTFMLPKTYSATAKVRVKNSVKTANPAEFLASLEKVAQSEAVLNPVVESLNLNKLWGRKVRVDADLKTWESVTLLMTQMELTSLPEARAMDVTVFDDDSQEAASIANRIAETLCNTPKNSEVELAERAQPNPNPIRPNIPLCLSMGAVGGLLTAFVFGSVAGRIALALGKGTRLAGGQP